MCEDDTLVQHTIVQFKKPVNPGEQIAVNLPDEGVKLHPDFGDAPSLWNSRKWLQEACEAKGAKFTGGGCGMGQADIDIILEGHHFNVSIKPIMRNP
jgi:hypothetical protein